jgi:hypothetical protein
MSQTPNPYSRPLPTRPCRYRGCNGGEIATGTYEAETGAADRRDCPGCGGREFQAFLGGEWYSPVSLRRADPSITFRPLNGHAL